MALTALRIALGGPYVVGSDEVTRQTALKYKEQGVAFVGIEAV